MLMPWDVLLYLNGNEFPKFGIDVLGRLGSLAADRDMIENFLKLGECHGSPKDVGHLFGLSISVETLSQATKNRLIIEGFRFATLSLFLRQLVLLIPLAQHRLVIPEFFDTLLRGEALRALFTQLHNEVTECIEIRCG